MAQDSPETSDVFTQNEVQTNTESQYFSQQVQDLYRNNPEETRQAFNSFDSRANFAQGVTGLPPMEIVNAGSDDSSNDNSNQPGPDAPPYEVQSNQAPDKSSGESHDNHGNSVSYETRTDGSVVVNSTHPGHNPKAAEKENTTQTYDNVIPGSARFHGNGNLQMDIMDPNNPQAGRIGDLSITQDGIEIKEYDKYNTSIYSDRPGGVPTDITSDAPGFQPYLDKDKDGAFEPEDLPGVRGADGTVNPENLPQNVHQDANGNLIYDLPKGVQGHDGPVQVSINPETGIASFTNDKGEVVRYEDPTSGRVLDKRDSNGDGVPEWWEDEPGKEPEQIPPGAPNEPTMNADGTMTYNTATQCVILGLK